MGGGARYPYPKEVWSPSGGWWSQPRNWRSNTAVCAVGIGIFSYFLWNYSVENESYHHVPAKWVPSMLWNPKLREAYEEQQKKNLA
ncbi:hypothetical protein IE81DRAFT_322212 [Ceraceosorus guamensis]|uniref:Uncharacterized protein n=1 Tax=Ceraceosorus guamensis TaxID=1522189 RepID=A0A316W7E2_9BASI|nr:hypothetical protein IE81DRAFT_322212 [Ceraceosorus guamensis]PWN43565.1 hypothetical protein IE81DRAFT_322212 [Ceraceosorus guamensis]